MDKATWDSIHDFVVQYPLSRIADYGVSLGAGAMSAIGLWLTRKLPRLSYVFLGGLIASLVIVLISAAIPYLSRSKQPWFKDDGLKWQVADSLYKELHAPTGAPRQPCQALVIHFSTPYSQKASGTIETVLEFAGCSVADILADRTLDDGIRVTSGRHGTSPTYAQALITKLNDVAGLNIPPLNFIDEPGHAVPEMNVRCWNPDIKDFACFAVFVGNESQL